MNKVILMGRLTRDPELRTTTGQVPVATFSLAVDRKYKGPEGQRVCDFIPIVCWRNQADFAGKFLIKGTKIVVIGELQTRNYKDKDGKTVYVTEIVAGEIEFAESKRADTGPHDAPQQDDFSAYTAEDTALPFDL